MTFYPLAKLHHLHDGLRRVCRVGRQELLLIQHDGCTYVMDRLCPHQGFPLEQGEVAQGRLTCPRHGFHFRLKDGACTPMAGCRLAVYPLVYQGDEVGVMWPD